MPPLPRTRPARPVAVALALGALTLAGACGIGGADGTSGPAAAAPPVGVHGAPGRVGTGLATASTRVGTVVTSGGLTLYTFDGDARKPSASRCSGDCATTWPPVLGDGQPALVGVDPHLVATFGRPDGTQQLTLGGRPLYRFSGDTAPGDVGGDGKDGRWHAVAPDGSPAAPS